MCSVCTARTVACRVALRTVRRAVAALSNLPNSTYIFSVVVGGGWAQCSAESIVSVELADLVLYAGGAFEGEAVGARTNTSAVGLKEVKASLAGSALHKVGTV